MPTPNGVVVVTLRYFVEFVYDIVIKQLPRFKNLLLIDYEHINTIYAIIKRLFGGKQTLKLGLMGVGSSISVDAYSRN